jgi:hypothetical protein
LSGLAILHPAGVFGFLPFNDAGQLGQTPQQRYFTLIIDNLAGIKMGVQVMGEQDGQLVILHWDGLSRRW